MRFGLALLIIAGLAVFPACAKKTTVVQGTNGPVTVTQDQANKVVSVESKQGKAVMGVGAVDPASLGLPVYPGAAPNESGSLAAQSKEGSAKIVTLTTTDSFDKVYAFYKDKMPAGSEKAHVTGGGMSMATFVTGKDTDREQKTVSISLTAGKVNITLVVGTKP